MKSLQELFDKKDRVKEFLKPLDKKLIDEMHKLVNRDRVVDGRKPLPWIAIKMKVNHLGLDDLGYLLKRMQQSVYPGKVFFGSLKIK